MLTIKVTGNGCTGIAAIRSLASFADRVEMHIREAMYDAAEAAYEVMTASIAGTPPYGVDPDAHLRISSGSFIPDGATRIFTGNWINSIDVFQKAHGWFIGSSSSPEYFFAQDEGWTLQDAPQGAVFGYVEGNFARQQAFEAAKTALEHSLKKNLPKR